MHPDKNCSFLAPCLQPTVNKLIEPQEKWKTNKSKKISLNSCQAERKLFWKSLQQCARILQIGLSEEFKISEKLPFGGAYKIQMVIFNRYQNVYYSLRFGGNYLKMCCWIGEI